MARYYIDRSYREYDCPPCSPPPKCSCHKHDEEPGPCMIGCIILFWLFLIAMAFVGCAGVVAYLAR